MSFEYLLLGHLFGDFVLQTNNIAKNKLESWKWTAIHSIIVTLSMLVFLMPFNWRVVGWVLLNGIMHFIVDTIKLRLVIRSWSGQAIYFLFDQIVHIGIIYTISHFVGKNLTYPFLSETVVRFLLVFLFVVSFACIFTQYILKIIFHDNKKVFFRMNEKGIGNTSRIVFLLTLYFSSTVHKAVLIGIPVFIIGMIYYYYKRLYRWMPLRYFVTKILLDLLISILGFLLLGWLAVLK
ncbi:MAG: DUF3307 domain-containing protein [Bacillota bacterium]